MPLTTRIAENGKTYAKLADLTKWEKNPRTRTDEDYIALKKKIVMLGLFKDFFVSSEGKVLGGNQRLDAISDLNANVFQWLDENKVLQTADLRGKFNEVPVTQLSFGEKEVDGVKKYYAILSGEPEETLFDSIEQIMIEYNIADNDPTGTTDKNLLMSLIQTYSFP